ncbi:MAG: hypothetical protein ACKVP0_05635 [Pirellulaceae bacterium]
MTTEGKKVLHPEYDVRLRVLPDDSIDGDGYRRLRAFLKAAIRSWRLQCVRITEAKPQTEAQP